MFNFYKISNGIKTFYLLGSVHTINGKSYFDRWPIIKNYLQESKYMFCETSFTEMIGLLISRGAFNGRDAQATWLSNHFDASQIEEIRSSVKEILNAFKIIDRQVEELAPWALCCLYCYRLVFEKGMDAEALKIAATAKIPVMPLDTQECTAELFDHFRTREYDELADELSRQMREGDQFESSYLHRMNEYLRLGGLRDFGLDDSSEDSEDDDLEIPKRNHEWVKKTNALEVDRYTIVCGLDHLHGEEGLLILYHKLGYQRIQQLSTQSEWIPVKLESNGFTIPIWRVENDLEETERSFFTSQLFSYRLLREANKQFLIENRYNSEEAQEAYDRQFGLILYKA